MNALYIIMLAALCMPTLQAAENEMPYGSQIIKISGSAGSRLEICPLFNNARWALSCRWDDSPKSDFKMAELMEQYGFKGTFYVSRSGHGADKEKELIARGHAIQSHAQTHRKLSIASYPQIWKELVRSRIDIETRTDYPVNMFAFPGNAFLNPARTNLQADICAMLVRAGYTGIAYSRVAYMTELSGYQALPGDGLPVDVEYNEILKNRELQVQDPMISWAYHTWSYEMNNTWALIEAQFKARAGITNVWYCTQNDYSAYRYQVARAKLRTIPSGNPSETAYELVRPSVLSAGAAVPLTLKLTGGDVTHCSVTVDGRQAETFSAGTEALLVNVPYPEFAKLPRTIAAIAPESGTDTAAKFPAIHAALGMNQDQTQLKLTLQNNAATLENIIITYRLPVPFSCGDTVRSIRRLEQGKTLEDSVALIRTADTFEYFSEAVSLIAQVDFTENGHAGRLYVIRETSYKPSDSPDNYIQGHIIQLTYPPALEKDKAAIIRVVQGGHVEKYRMGTRTVGWNPAASSPFDYPDGIASGNKNTILLSSIHLPARTELEFATGGIKRLWIDGQAFCGAGAKATLDAGTHLLTMLPLGDMSFRILTACGATFKTPAFDNNKMCEIESKADNAAEEYFVRQWLLAGPFPDPGKAPDLINYDKDFLAEAGGERKARPEIGKSFTYAGSEYIWKYYESPADFINLKTFLQNANIANTDKLIMYAYTRLEAAEDTAVYLGLGSDDGYKLYLNGTLLAGLRVFRAAAPFQEMYKVRLQKGANHVLLKMEQDVKGFGFYLNIASEDGLSALSGVKVVTSE